MNKKVSLLLGAFLLVLAVCFLAYAAYIPGSLFPWSNKVAYLLYGGYLWLLFKFLLDIPFLQAMRKTPSNGSLFRAILFLLMAVVFFVMELTAEAATIYTVLGGWIMVGGVDVCTENLFYAFMQRKKGP